MIALVDADICLYRVGFTTENEVEQIAQFRMEELVHRILEDVKADGYKLYLSAGRNDTFRAKINPEYKANRVQPKPLHYEFLKNYLIDVWKAEVQVEQEADDALGIEQTKNVEGTIICSIDKDLMQIAGNHYNFVKNEFTHITPEEGLLFFYKQLLIGDTADNIKGVSGIGKAKADKILDEYLGLPEEDILEVVQEKYRNWLMQEWVADYDSWEDFHEKQVNNIILKNGQCLKIRTKEGEIWSWPQNLNTSLETLPV